ncbi:MAG: sce7726 family protein [Lachnospiraceae bacterium]|nr:sce7726 family protein [Lachnospiraceae bacterium]
MKTVLHDSDIRDDLCDYLEQKYGQVRFFDELVIGKSRADIVMVTRDAIIGVEIKSDADTYTRLKGQIPDYDRYFDKNILAVGSTHAMHAPEHIPDHWGLISVEETGDGLDFYEVREPGASKAKIRKQLDLLWRRELYQLQGMNGLHKYSNKRRAFVEKYVVESVDESLLKQQIRDILFERDYSIFDDQ